MPLQEELFGVESTTSAMKYISQSTGPIPYSVHRVDDRWSGTGVDISPLIERYKIPGLLLRHEDSWWSKYTTAHNHAHLII